MLLANQDENEDGESTSKRLKSEHGKTRVNKISEYIKYV